MSLFPSAPSENDAITGATLNLTKGSAFGAGAVAVAAAINPLFEAVFGDAASDWIKAAIIITAVAGWAAIAVADVLARGYAHAHHAPHVVALSGAPKVKLTKGTDKTGWTAAAVRTNGGHPDTAEFLVTRPGQAGRWEKGEDVEFDS